MMKIPEYVKEYEKAQQIYLDAIRKQGWTFSKFKSYLSQHLDTLNFDEEKFIDLYDSCAIDIMQTEINDVESWVAYHIKTNNRNCAMAFAKVLSTPVYESEGTFFYSYFTRN